MIQLRWEGDAKNQYLFAGSNDTELAWLEKRKKLWSAVVWLPGVDRGKEYNTLAAHQKNIEEKVQHWFARAMGDETGVFPWIEVRGVVDVNLDGSADTRIERRVVWP